MAINLEKAAQNLKVSLQKAGITLNNLFLQVAFILDVSGSFTSTHRNGTTDLLLERLVPWAMVFDKDQKMDAFTFSDKQCNAVHVGEITLKNYVDYVKKSIVDKVKGWGGFTDYHFVIKKALQHFGWVKKGFFGNSGKKEASLVFFVTDGTNDDKKETEELLRESEARGDKVYFLFIGVHKNLEQFAFINKMGEKFSNVGFVGITDMVEWVKKTDNEINELFLTEELRNWLISA